MAGRDEARKPGGVRRDCVRRTLRSRGCGGEGARVRWRSRMWTKTAVSQYAGTGARTFRSESERGGVDV